MSAGASEAEDLPERKIPGHHRQNRSDRLIADETALGARLHCFVGQEPLGVLRVIAARRRALGGLGHRAFRGLPISSVIK